MAQLTPFQERLIKKKVDLLQRIKKGSLSAKDLSCQRVAKKEVWCD